MASETKKRKLDETPPSGIAQPASQPPENEEDDLPKFGANGRSHALIRNFNLLMTFVNFEKQAEAKEIAIKERIAIIKAVSDNGLHAFINNTKKPHPEKKPKTTTVANPNSFLPPAPVASNPKSRHIHPNIYFSAYRAQFAAKMEQLENRNLQLSPAEIISKTKKVYKNLCLLNKKSGFSHKAENDVFITTLKEFAKKKGFSLEEELEEFVVPKSPK